jgi:hypothetical protein
VIRKLGPMNFDPSQLEIGGYYLYHPGKADQPAIHDQLLRYDGGKFRNKSSEILSQVPIATGRVIRLGKPENTTIQIEDTQLIERAIRDQIEPLTVQTLSQALLPEEVRSYAIRITKTQEATRTLDRLRTVRHNGHHLPTR